MHFQGEVMLRAQFSVFTALLIMAFSFSSFAAMTVDQANESCAYRFSFIFQDFAFKQKIKLNKSLVFYSKDEDKKLIANYSIYYKANDNSGTINKKQKDILKENQAIFNKYNSKEFKICVDSIMELSKSIDSKCNKLTSTNPEEKKNLDECMKKNAIETSKKGSAAIKSFFEYLSSKKKII